MDKYLGDGVMAFFGVPVQHPDDASRAVSTALGVHQAMQGLKSCFTALNLPPVEIGVCVNTVLVVAGNMGSETRLNYTVIGDGVNLASRLEALTRHYGIPTIVNEPTRDAARDFAFLELDRVRVKGKANAVSIFQPIALLADLDEDTRLRLAIHHETLALYRERAWEAARERFRDCERMIEGGCGVAAVYLKRIERFLEEPPAADWEGVVTFSAVTGEA